MNTSPVEALCLSIPLMYQSDSAVAALICGTLTASATNGFGERLQRRCYPQCSKCVNPIRFSVSISAAVPTTRAHRQ